MRRTLRKGHAASQNVIESFMARLRRSTQKHKEVRTVLTYLGVIEKVCNKYAMTPGAVFSICGPGSTHCAQPEFHGTLSAEMVDGPGKRIFCAGQEMHFPTCESLVSEFKAMRARNIATVVRGTKKFLVMPRLAKLGHTQVNREEATRLVDMLCAANMEEAKSLWVRFGLMDEDSAVTNVAKLKRDLCCFGFGN